MKLKFIRTFSFCLGKKSVFGKLGNCFHLCVCVFIIWDSQVVNWVSIWCPLKVRIFAVCFCFSFAIREFQEG